MGESCVMDKAVSRASLIERDASDAQKIITEVNSGIIMAPCHVLRFCLKNMVSENSQNEYHLTDVFSIAHQKGIPTIGFITPVPADLEGANDRIQLAALEQRYRMKMSTELMRSGVQLADPGTD